MSYMDHIKACNRYRQASFIPFLVDGVPVGRVRHGFAEHLTAWPRVFRVSRQRLDLAVETEDLESRSAAVAEVLGELVETGVISHLHGELYAATSGGPGQACLLLDRAAAPYFGIRAFGQHMNGFVRTGEGLKLWVAKRSSDRIHYPGKLDNLVAGGLPYGISLKQNLHKECWEEAGIAADLASLARPVGSVSYYAETEKGFKPDTLYCYDLELPEDFMPRCTDGEVESFHLWPIERVMETVRDSDDFKLNCNLVIIDFLLRHGCLEPEDEDYLALVEGLHPSLPPFGQVVLNSGQGG